MTHQIEILDLLEWQKEAKKEFASSRWKINKSLYWTLRWTFEVWLDNEKVLETNLGLSAVAKYNSL